jgi:hypothetical protein
MAENFVDTSPVRLLAFWAAVGNLAFLALEDPLLQRNSVQTPNAREKFTSIEKTTIRSQ